jgi:hypothetical protein
MCVHARVTKLSFCQRNGETRAACLLSLLHNKRNGAQLQITPPITWWRRSQGKDFISEDRHCFVLFGAEPTAVCSTYSASQCGRKRKRVGRSSLGNVVFSDYLEFWAMDKVHKSSDSECSAPSSEPSRSYRLRCICIFYSLSLIRSFWFASGL